MNIWQAIQFQKRESDEACRQKLVEAASEALGLPVDDPACDLLVRAALQEEMEFTLDTERMRAMRMGVIQNDDRA